MHLYEAVRILAMKAVTDPDEEALLRKVRRWYSQNLNTPLHVVETLDPVAVFREYWEFHFEEMDEDARQQELEEMLETPEQALERDRQFHKEEVDSIRIRKKIENSERLAAAARAAGEVAPTAAQPVMKFAGPKPAGKDTSLSKLPEKKAEDTVKISFVTADDLEAELRGDALNRKP